MFGLGKNFFILGAGLLIVSIALLSPCPTSAQFGPDFGVRFAEDTGLNEEDPRSIANILIQITLGFLVVLAIVIILFAGFKWMTAGGNQEQISQAKKILFSGIIGLVIILSSWAITNFVLQAVTDATTPKAGPTYPK